VGCKTRGFAQEAMVGFERSWARQAKHQSEKEQTTKEKNKMKPLMATPLLSRTALRECSPKKGKFKTTKEKNKRKELGFARQDKCQPVQIKGSS